MAATPTLVAPAGARCAEHPELDAIATCPFCGSFACLACWSSLGSPSCCVRCVARAESGPVVPLEVGAVIRAAWDTYTRAPWPLILPSLLRIVPVVFFYAVFIYVEFSAGSQGRTTTPVEALAAFGTYYGISFLYAPLYEAGQAAVALRAARSQPVTAGHFFGAMRYWLVAAAAMLLLAVPFFVGFLLLIVPGVVLAIGFSLWPFFLVDKRGGPVASLGESWRATRGRKAEIFVIYLILFLMNVAGAIACCIPMLVLTQPLSAAATAVVYTTCASSRAPRA